MLKLSRFRALAIALVMLGASVTVAEDEIDPLSFDRSIEGLLGRYCYKCHNADDANGDVDLRKDNNIRLIADNAVVWRTALDRIDSKEMPPQDSRQPTGEERELIAKFLRKTLDEYDCEANPDPGNPSIRRLNRAEYDNSIRELTGLDLHLADAFPADASSYGFDNIAASQALSPLQVEQYYDAAQEVVNALMANKRGGAKSNAKPPIGYRRVYFRQAREDDVQRDVAQAIVTRFAERATRRPADIEWIGKLLSIYDRSRDERLEHDEAIGKMLMAVLISPRFLVRAETTQPDATEPYAVDDFDLASRLSFFLWSGPPDDKLMQLAKAKKLHRPKDLDQQITRMLADRRSDALIDNFFAPWLQIDGLADHKPDLELFPDFDQSLHDAIAAEPRHLLRELIREDRPITDIIDCDYTYANQTLARHYGIEAVAGQSMQRVSLTDRRRGGLLTSAALLMSQADPGRTNVPRRGNFIAGTFLGTPAPPPPPDVPELAEPDASGQPLTLRQRLEQHRSSPQCASCHDKIDPLGFGWENYDAIGRWRDTEVGKTVDASGELPSGQTFAGPIELKQILLEQKDTFTRTFASQLLIYALARGPIRADQCVLDKIAESARSNEFRFAAIVRSIVHSYPFLYRRNADL